MYGMATSAVQINVYKSGVFPIRHSVRQGCRLSMTLFTLFVNPLLVLLTQSLPGVRIGHGNTQTSVTKYANDITLLLTNPEDLQVAMELIQEYGRAMGARLNIRKSKALAVGSWNTSASVANVSYSHANLHGPW